MSRNDALSALLVGLVIGLIIILGVAATSDGTWSYLSASEIILPGGEHVQNPDMLRIRSPLAAEWRVGGVGGPHYALYECGVTVVKK